MSSQSQSRKILFFGITFLLCGFSQFLITSNSHASGPVIGEYKSCTVPGQYKADPDDENSEYVCARGLNGKLLWLVPGYVVAPLDQPGSPLMRPCSVAGDRKVLQFWIDNPLEKKLKSQFACVIVNSTLLRSVYNEDYQALCFISIKYNIGDNLLEEANCKVGPPKVGQKVWLEIQASKPFTNVVRPSQIASFPATQYVTRDFPEIPSCFIEQSCEASLQTRYKALLITFPNVIIHPARN